MKIPLSLNKKFKIGDDIIIINQLYSNFCMFYPGHKFQIINYDLNYDRYILEDKDHDILTVRGTNDITHIISIKNSEQEFKDHKEKTFFTQFFHTNCPHQDIQYDDRDVINHCVFVEQRWIECSPSEKCFKYYKDFEKTDERISQYIRKTKLNSLI